MKPSLIESLKPELTYQWDYNITFIIYSGGITHSKTKGRLQKVQSNDISYGNGLLKSIQFLISEYFIKNKKSTTN